jgi:hypothetical protein
MLTQIYTFIPDLQDTIFRADLQLMETHTETMKIQINILTCRLSWRSTPVSFTFYVTIYP